METVIQIGFLAGAAGLGLMVAGSAVGFFKYQRPEFRRASLWIALGGVIPCGIALLQGVGVLEGLMPVVALVMTSLPMQWGMYRFRTLVSKQGRPR